MRRDQETALISGLCGLSVTKALKTIGGLENPGRALLERARVVCLRTRCSGVAPATCNEAGRALYDWTARS